MKPEKMYEMAQELENRAKTICEVLKDRAMDESETIHELGGKVMWSGATLRPLVEDEKGGNRQMQK